MLLLYNVLKKQVLQLLLFRHKQYPNREAFDDVMHQQLLDWDIDLVVLAGFMRILS